MNTKDQSLLGKALLLTILSWGACWLFVMGLTIIGYMIGKGEPFSFLFLRYMPGLSTGPLAGSLGGFFFALIALYVRTEAKEPAYISPFNLSLCPILGLIAGVVIFLVFVITGGFRVSEQTWDQGDIFAILNELRPTTGIQTGTFLLSSFAAGFYFRDIPRALRSVSSRFFKQTENEKGV